MVNGRHVVIGYELRDWLEHYISNEIEDCDQSIGTDPEDLVSLGARAQLRDLRVALEKEFPS